MKYLALPSPYFSMKENFIKISIYSAIPFILVLVIIAIWCYKSRNSKKPYNKMKSRRYKFAQHDTNHIAVDFSPKNLSHPSTFLSINESPSEESSSEKDTGSPINDHERSSSLAKFVKHKDIDDYEMFSKTHKCIRNQCMENFTQTEELEKDVAVQAEIVRNTFYESSLRNLSDQAQMNRWPHCQLYDTSKSLVINRAQDHETFHCLNSSQAFEDDSEILIRNLRISRWLKECERFSTDKNFHQNTIYDTFNVSPLRCRSFEEWPLTRSNGDHRVARNKNFSNRLYNDAGELKCAQRKSQSFSLKIGLAEVNESDYDVDYRCAEPIRKMHNEKHDKTWESKECRENGLCIKDFQDTMAEEKGKIYLPQVRYEEIWRGDCGSRHSSRWRIEDENRKEIGKKLKQLRPQGICETFSKQNSEDNNRNPYVSDYFNQDHFDRDYQNETRHKAFSQDRYLIKKQKDKNASYLYQEYAKDKFRKDEGIVYREDSSRKMQKETRKRDEVTGKISELYFCPQKLECKFKKSYSEETFCTKHFKDQYEIEPIEEKSYENKSNDKWQEMYSTRKPSPDTSNAEWQDKVPERYCYYRNHEEKVFIPPRERDSPRRTMNSKSSCLSHENKDCRVQKFSKYGRGKCKHKLPNKIVSLENSSKSSDEESFPESNEDKSELPEFRRDLHHIENNQHKGQGQLKGHRSYKNASSGNFQEESECESCEISYRKQNPDFEMFENPAKNNDDLGVADIKEKCDNNKKLMQNQMSPFKEENEITSKPTPERKTIGKYLRGQYHNLDDDITNNSKKMVQELKEVLKKRGVAI